MAAQRIRIVGRGRAGGAFANALAQSGWLVDAVGGRDPAASHAGDGVDVVLICVTDAAIGDVAKRLEPSEAVVAHVAGSLGLDVLGPHPRRAAVHPLVALPDAELGATRLHGATFAIAGDPVAQLIVDALAGRAIEVPDENRLRYHAAAVIASNHVVGLLGQAARVAASVGLPFDVYVELVRETVDNVSRLGPASALTGPAARGDVRTIEAHLAALDADEREAYRVMSGQCRRLAQEGRP